MKKLLYVEFRAFRKEKKKREPEMQKGPERATALFRVWVATWFGGCRRFLGRDKGFLVRDKASWLYVATWFSLCHDMVFSFKLWKMLQYGVSLLRQVWAWLGIF